MDTLEKMGEYYNSIHDNRIEIANTKAAIAMDKAKYWEEATGTVDQKKDYIKSKIADKEKDIRLCEASIEFAYNMIELLNWRILSEDD